MADRKKPKGWVKEPVRHGLAAKGIKTGRKIGFEGTREHPMTSFDRTEAERILHRIRNKHISPEQFMDLTGELHTFAEQFPDDSDEYIVLRELEWIFVQLHDDPPRLLREKWGYKPKGER